MSVEARSGPQIERGADLSKPHLVLGRQKYDVELLIRVEKIRKYDADIAHEIVAFVRNDPQAENDGLSVYIPQIGTCQVSGGNAAL